MKASVGRLPFVGVFVLLLLAACQPAAPTPDTQATLQALVATQLAQATPPAPPIDYPATIAAQATQIAGLQSTLAAPTSAPPTIAPTPTPTPDQTLLLRQALAAYLAWPLADVDMEIGEIRGQWARGSIRRKGEMEGAGWFALYRDGFWTIAYVGQGVPPCKRVNALNIPKDWVDYCVTESGQTVAR